MLISCSARVSTLLVWPRDVTDGQHAMRTNVHTRVCKLISRAYLLQACYANPFVRARDNRFTRARAQQSVICQENDDCSSNIYVCIILLCARGRDSKDRFVRGPRANTCSTPDQSFQRHRLALNASACGRHSVGRINTRTRAVLHRVSGQTH